MKITAIKLENVRGFQNLPKTEFSKTINVFIGSNNSGKSTILNSIFLLQQGSLNNSDITIGKNEGTVDIFYEGNHLNYFPKESFYDRIVFNLSNGIGNPRKKDNSHIGSNFRKIISHEPENLIYPYLSKRKTVNYSENINEGSVNSVLGNFTDLYSKIDRLITPQYQPGNSEYIKACNEVLGFEVSTLAKGAGKKAVYYIHKNEHIPLTSMGEGVASVIGLIIELCIAENKIFLIEELENDIHPKALKSLLKIIVEKSATNQFFISTHSNIVMKQLGSEENCKIFNITNDERDSRRENLFISKLTEISQNEDERRQVLEDLGYDFFDFDLWKAWLFLEESSAEVIIRDYLIEWFVKPLKGKIKTFSAGGVDKIDSKFEDFNKLFVFLHLEPTYKNKVWVKIDGGENEEKIISKMKEVYTKSGWNNTNFSQFSEHDFENYYPKEFQEKVAEVLAVEDKKLKRTEKLNLLRELKLWINENEDLAKEQFKDSAKEVIDFLKKINKEI